MHQLLATPIILEMENIGSDDEKTFLMGLFLAKLYEYRRLQAATGAVPFALLAEQPELPLAAPVDDRPGTDDLVA